MDINGQTTLGEIKTDVQKLAAKIWVLSRIEQRRSKGRFRLIRRVSDQSRILPNYSLEPLK